MSKKLTIEFVKKEFEKEGYAVLSEEYVGAHDKIKYMCPEGHSSSMCYSNWKRGRRCRYCAIDKQRLDFRKIKKAFASEGYTIVTTAYVNSGQHLQVICPKGHTSQTLSWDSWKGGHRCKICAGNQRTDIKDIKLKFEKEGYQLLTTTYIPKEKLEYICPNGHRHNIDYPLWNTGSRCPTCKGITIEEVKNSFESAGYILKTTIYKNSKRLLEGICPAGHKISVTWTAWGRGVRCSKCRRKKEQTASFEELKQSFSNEGYTLLSKQYINSHSKVDFICPQGHHNKIAVYSWKNGQRCGECFRGGISKIEVEIYNFIHQSFPDASHNDKSIIFPLELDIVIPSKKVAIEYCGLYWHSELLGKTKNYHLNKLNKAKEQGYRLITIFEDEYLNHKEVVLDRLKIILGVSNSTKVNARDCTIKEIDTKVARIFCDTYHLQGYGNSNVKLGAYLNNQLLSVMTFSKPSVAKGTKSSDDNTYELNRFCSKIGYNIRGIASKLLTHFNRNYKPSSIISYADKRWSDGNLYKMLGFKHTHDSDPNYWYIKQDRRIHRFNFRKNVLKDKLEKFDPSISEWKNMVNNGYNRIWDCGNMKFVLLI